ncbi:Hypothetical protein P9303_20361 [Prochlorococcus marinus str. MIT 9303]|uniref:Uncharacterized protein n=1 Tax=Prochlorococcus marinus (strain MIT 9303) TaxID=59922 RepID=A2CBB6_PROM3|nr:Hypothetical protein P9303_20361 [Prochlorococcus marinus str. MIT 9303]
MCGIWWVLLPLKVSGDFLPVRDLRKQLLDHSQCASSNKAARALATLQNQTQSGRHLPFD